MSPGGAEQADRDNADVLAAQGGDGEAFVRLVQRHKRSLSSHLLRFSNNETVLQDLRQETYFEAYRSLSTYRRRGPFSSWLRQIASRVGYRYWAGQAREVQAKSAYLELRRYCASTRPPQPVQDGIERVKELLTGVGRGDGILLEMKYAQGLNATEIARSLGWNVVRVRVRLHRILKKLRSIHSRNHET